MPRVEAEVGNTANSYEILAKLATGGMAEIFLARNASSAGVERYVVLKRILRHRANDQAFVRMFLDEARLAALLQHPNIAQVYDIGKLGDSYFFTMEYVHGETVRALLQRSHALRSPIPLGSVLVTAAGSAAGLHHAHERNGYDGKPLGIVHRDVSPSNLMVSYEGGVKVVDFGVAKAAHSSHETRSGTVKGKISYLSPEQCRGNPVDRRSDLFSLGIVLWEMLTSERLYKRASDFETMHAIVSEPVPPPSTRRPEITAELDALVLHLLAKDPNARFQTADEVHEAIEGVAVRLGLPLSSPSLARYLRDLFGQRPEPWIEMQSREAHPEAFTVTSEPIPAQLDARPTNLVESQLGAVPDLSGEVDEGSEASPPAAFPRIPTGQRTTPFRAEEPPRGPNPLLSTLHGPGMPSHPRAQIGATGPQQPITGPQSARSSFSSAPQPVLRDASGPVHAVAQSGSGYPLYIPPVPSHGHRVPQERKLPRPLVIVLAAITLGIVFGIILAAGGGPPAKAVHRDAAVAVAMVSIGAQPDAGPDAQPDAPPPIDAAVAIVSPDAAVAARVELSPVEMLSRQLDRGLNSDAVATCIANPSLVGSVPVSCVQAACRAHDAAHARRWSAAVKKTPGLASACKEDGVALESATDLPTEKKPPIIAPRRDCESDPMACQH